MTIASVNTWVFGDKLTYAQANSLDANTQAALDKRSGQTDTLQSVVTATGSGRIIESHTTAANADHTYAVADGVRILNAAADTGSRNYTLSNTGASNGDRISVLGVSNSAYTTTIKNNGGTTLIVLGTASNSTSAWAEFLHNGTDWILFQYAQVPPSIYGFMHRPIFYEDTATTTGASVITNQEFQMLTDTQVRFNPTGTSYRTVYTAGTAAYYYVQLLDPGVLRQGKTLSSVVLTLKPAAGHGALPQQMPAVSVIRNSIGSWSASPDLLLSTGNGWATDGSASVVAYEPEHNITFTPNQNNVIDFSAYTYSLVFMNEGGSNALASGTTSGVKLTFT